MRRVLITTVVLLEAVYAVRAQVFLMVTDSAHLQHYIDSVTRHYYGDFCGVGNIPVIPLYGDNNLYRTPLVEIRTEVDMVDCMVEISYGTTDKRTYKNRMGRANLCVRDRTFPTINPLHRHYAHKYLKGRRKRYKFKLVSYIRCAPPQYPKQEIKKITAEVNYDALMPMNTKISYKVKHLPFSTDAKYGPCTYEDEKKARLRRKRDEERSRAFGESLIARRQKVVSKRIRKANAKAKAASKSEAAFKKEPMR